METTIILTGKEAKQWTMMKVLDSMGAFDIRYGSFEVHIDGEGKISNVKIIQNYRPEILTVAIKNKI